MDFMNLVCTADAGIWCMLNVFLGGLSSPSFLVTLVQVFVLVCPVQFQSSKYVSESTHRICTKSALLFSWPLSMSSDKLYFVGDKRFCPYLLWNGTFWCIDELQKKLPSASCAPLTLIRTGNRSMIWRDCHNKLSFLGISCGRNEWKPLPNWSWINKTQGKLSKDIVRPIFQCFILIFPQWNKGDLCVFPLSNKPFHVCIGEIQVFLDGPIGKPKNCLLCVVAVDFVASSCTSQIYKRTANSLSVRSVAAFQKQISKK
jgi:hypothetical protein